MKLSVIIPVYRTEDTLCRCVKSVLEQDYPDTEIILVDDGSPDNCPQLCDEWVEKDRHIHVIHKKNGGLSDARNRGMQIATGEYITFVDSDDYIAAHTFRPLMDRLARQPDIDILEYPIFVHYGAGNQHKIAFQPEAVYQDMEAYWLEGQAYLHTYACNKIFRKSLFDDIRFPEGKVFEDAQTLPLLIRKAKTVQTISLGLYYYCDNTKGITRNADGHALRMLLEPHVEMISRISRRDKAFQSYYLHVLNIQMDVFEQTGDTPILPALPVKAGLFSGVQKAKALAINLSGINGICKLNKLIHKIWRSH